MPNSERNTPAVDDLPRTPTMTNVEIQHFGNTISGPNSPNIDFETAAFMLMSNDTSVANSNIETNTNATSNIVTDNMFLRSPRFQNTNSNSFMSNIQMSNNMHYNLGDIHSNMKLPFAHVNQFTTPPPPSASAASVSGLALTPSTSFDFDAIGQLLMSPKSNNLIDTSLNTNPPLSTGMNPAAGKEFSLSALNSPSMNSWNLHALSPQIPLPYAPSPTNSIGMLNTMFPKSPISVSNLGLNVNTTNMPSGGNMGDYYNASSYNHGLLSNTESMALETFLDSIANEGSNKKEKRKKTTENTPVNVVNESIDVLDTELPTKKRQKLKVLAVDSAGSGSKQKRRESKKVKLPVAPKKTLSKKERQLAHNITEQKRRDMIKSAFEKLNDIVLNSKFELRDTTESEETTKKRKRKASTNKPKSLKKYEVLQRSVKEIQILVEKNAQLYELLGETESVQKIDELDIDGYIKEGDTKQNNDS